MNGNIDALAEYIAKLIVENRDITKRVETLETKLTAIEKDVQHMIFKDMQLM